MTTGIESVAQLSSPRPWTVHVSGGQLSIKDAKGKFVFRKGISALPSIEAFNRLKADFDIIVSAVNALPAATG